MKNKAAQIKAQKKEDEERKNKRVTGAKYEELAAGYLLKQGFVILERNYTAAPGEIDIIAKDGEYLVFCEVKYRSSKESGGAEFALPASKRMRIGRVAKAYMVQKHVRRDQLCRFDCVLIDGKEINHIKNAWQL